MLCLQEGSDYKKLCDSAVYPRIVIAEKSVVVAAAGRSMQSMPVPNNMLGWGAVLLRLLSLFYAFNLPYPQGYDVAMLILQARVLEDDIHDDDQTTEFVKVYDRYAKFLEK